MLYAYPIYEAYILCGCTEVHHQHHQFLSLEPAVLEAVSSGGNSFDWLWDLAIVLCSCR